MPPFTRTGNTAGGITFRPQQPPPATPMALIEDAIREATATERWLPAPSQVRALTNRLRAFISAAAYEVEAAAAGRPVGDPFRDDALAAAREARHRLGLGPGDGYVSAISFARGLARSAEELRHHQRQLQPKGGGTSVVAMAHGSGPGVIVVGPAETCAVCLGLTAQRHTSERRHDWAGMRRANTRLVEHRDSVHARRKPPSTGRATNAPH
ncbi:DUF6415 family natural product biosynthesis protein [Streptomyces sp. NPDC026206]|uniref:DUF6415 family natural product biosynthesis protein n=1 Tax=Streptomyces sp. NPDC026206 TaxID=3157089 RepID=UPI00340B68D6